MKMSKEEVKRLNKRENPMGDCTAEEMQIFNDVLESLGLHEDQIDMDCIQAPIETKIKEESPQQILNKEEAREKRENEICAYFERLDGRQVTEIDMRLPRKNTDRIMVTCIRFARECGFDWTPEFIKQYGIEHSDRFGNPIYPLVTMKQANYNGFSIKGLKAKAKVELHTKIKNEEGEEIWVDQTTPLFLVSELKPRFNTNI